MHVRVVKIWAAHLFDSYCRVVEADHSADWDARRASEVSKRLKQLDWLLIETQRRELDIMGGVLKFDDPRRFELMDEILLFAEAFYWFAWRTREALVALPHLGSFDPIGVRQVRNHLIEHPDKKRGLFSMGWQMGNDDHGPTLDNRLESDPHDWKDAGLYENAREFDNKLFTVLSPFLKRDIELRRIALTPPTP